MEFLVLLSLCVRYNNEGNKLLSAQLLSVRYEDIPLFVLTAIYFPRYELNGTLLSLYAGKNNNLSLQLVH